MSSLPTPVRSVLGATAVAVLVGAGATACNDSVAAGTVVEGDSFTKIDGESTTVLVPSGRLKVTVGEPVAEVEGKDGQDTSGEFVPITFSYHTSTGPAAVRLLGLEPRPVTLGLESGDDAVTVGELGAAVPAEERLQPDTTYYVAVGEAETPTTLTVGYDGLTQRVDLETGKREAGPADLLYDRSASRPTPDCPDRRWQANRTGRFPLTCDVRFAVLTPYLPEQGGWAAAGRAWAVVDLTVRGFEATASGSTYLPGDGTLNASVDDVTATEPVTGSDGELDGRLAVDVPVDAEVDLDLRADYTYSLDRGTGQAELPVTLERTLRPWR